MNSITAILLQNIALTLNYPRNSICHQTKKPNLKSRFYFSLSYKTTEVKAMDSGIVLSEFVFQSRYYVHFRTNTLGKRYEPPYPPSYGLNSTSTVLLGEWLWH